MSQRQLFPFGGFLGNDLVHLFSDMHGLFGFIAPHAPWLLQNVKTKWSLGFTVLSGISAETILLILCGVLRLASSHIIKRIWA